MITFRKHIPDFVITDPEKFEEYKDLDELLSSKKVSVFKREGFHRFSISDNQMLMAEFNDGKEWLVGGY